MALPVFITPITVLQGMRSSLTVLRLASYQKMRELKKDPLPRDLQGIFKFHDRADMGNPKTAEGADNPDQCLFIRSIKDCHRRMPPDKKVPVDELHFRRIPEVFPELDHLVGIFRAEFEPEYKQHLITSLQLTSRCPELPEGMTGEQKLYAMFQGIER
jgi:hypothetical protein